MGWLARGHVPWVNCTNPAEQHPADCRDEASGAETRGRKPPRESRNDPQGGRPFPDFLEEAPGQTASWWP